jgi:hypothetical protein
MTDQEVELIQVQEVPVTMALEDLVMMAPAAEVVVPQFANKIFSSSRKS